MTREDEDLLDDSYNRRAAHDLRFRARCWWLNREVDVLEWHLRLESHAGRGD
jgi:hypothetical protein